MTTTIETPDTTQAGAQAATPPELLPDGRMVSRFGAVTAAYSADADAVAARLGEGAIYASVELEEDACTLDYTEDGRIVAVEFLGVGRGVSLQGVPRRQEIEATLRALAITINDG